MARIAFLTEVSILINCSPHVICLHEPESIHQMHLLIGFTWQYPPVHLKLFFLTVRLIFIHNNLWFTYTF